jgi:pyruvate,water dikinase
VLGLIAAHLRASGNAGVAANSEAIRDAAHRRILAGLEEGERQQFLAFVGMLNGLVQVREDRAYWQMRLVGAARRLLLRKGEALVRDGVIESAADILFLKPMEFEAANPGDLRSLVTRRKEEWEGFKTLTPPAFIGAPPAEAQPESLSARELRGLPGSRGTATGTARIITSPDDFDRFEEGDILVCRLTTPSWTPLIGLAAALVTETGSPMSHPAITAREYGIPCVLSVVDATKFITDGQLVTVDGEKGIVSLDG